MKSKFFRSFTFYFMISSPLMIFMHYQGNDSHGIVLFHMNVLLKSVLYNDVVVSIVQSGPKIPCGSVAGEVYLYWYAAHFITFVLYGLFFDSVKALFRKPTAEGPEIN